MSRKKADANLLDMPGVPAVPKSPFSADAGAAALKPAAQPATAAVQPKLPVPAKPVTQTRQVPYGAGPLPTRQPPQGTRFSLGPPVPLPTNRPEQPGRAAAAATAPGFRPEVPLPDKPPVRVEDWPNNSPPGDPVEMRQQQQRYNRLLERQQQRATDAAAEDTPRFPGLNEFLGFERTDPRTGKRVHTTPAELGQDQAGFNGAVSAGLAGIPSLAVNSLPLLAGDTAPFLTSARDVLSPLNYILGTDIGHNWKPDAAVSSAYEPENPALRESFTRAKSSPTTTGFFSSPYDPLTETYKPSVADGAAAMSRHFADDQTNGANKLQRILAGTHSAVASNAGKAIAALTPARAMKYVAGAPALLSNPFATGAMVQGGAALTDPSITGNATQRGLYAAAQGLEGAYSPLAANPLLMAPQGAANQFGVQDAANAAGQWIRNTPWGTAQTKTPTSQREGVTFVRDLYGGMGGVPGDSAASQRALAHGAAGVVESLPTTLPALFTGGSKSLLGNPKAIREGMYNARNYIANSAITGGIQGATNTATPAADKPVLSQADDAVTANLWDMHAKEQRANPAIGDNTGAMAELLRRQQVQNPAAGAAISQASAPAPAAPAATGSYLPPQPPTRTESTLRRQEIQPNFLRPLLQPEDLQQSVLQRAGTTVTPDMRQLYQQERENLQRGMRNSRIPYRGLDSTNSQVRPRRVANGDMFATPVAGATPQELREFENAKLRRDDDVRNFNSYMSEQLDDLIGAAPAQAVPAPAATTQAAPEQAAPAQPAQQQPDFDYQHVLPKYHNAKQFAETNPEMTAQITTEATKRLQTAASTPEGKAVLAHVDKTGELPPKADEVAQYNLINDGFDADKIGEWYGNLGGAEKFALWGGVSMTVLGLMHAMNGGGVGGMLAALLGLGTAGLTAGQSGLFGDAAQEQSQKITQPVGSAISGGLTAVAGKALSNPSILKMVAPHLDSLPDGIRDSVLQKMQDHMRQSKDPEMLKKVEGLNAVHGQGWKGVLNNAASSFGAGNIARQQAIQQLTEAGFTPTTANRFVDLWAKQQ